MITVNFDRAMLQRFKKAFKRVTKNKSKTSFKFEGNEYNVSYAKYLIEYLESKFKED